MLGNAASSAAVVMLRRLITWLVGTAARESEGHLVGTRLCRLAKGIGWGRRDPANLHMSVKPRTSRSRSRARSSAAQFRSA